VGTGKSMLMDLFHASVGIEAKRRVHFHAFMQEVQAGLNAARKRGVDDAILPVAERIAGSCGSCASTRCRSPTSPMR
jgi:cell division protein ZapE